MAMNPTASGTRGVNTHSYPAYDYPVGVGTGLVACKDGTITDMPGDITRRLIGHLQNGDAWPTANQSTPNSGNVLTVSHGNGEYTCYLHASPYDVNIYRGKRVNKGEVFARSGHNGWSTGPHLHFEVWKNGVRIDPGLWLNNISTGGSMQSDAEKLADMRLAEANRTRVAIGLPSKNTNSEDDIRRRVVLINGDVDNLLKDVGITPTQADYNALNAGPKEFVYYLQSRLKTHFNSAQPGEGTVLAPGNYKVV